jgi:hypothetical protein
MNKILIYIIVGLVLAFSVQSYLYKKSRAEAKRQTQNVENLVKQKDQELTLTRKEFKRAETHWKHEVDSLLEAEKIALNKVTKVTVVKTVYRDTTYQDASMGEPEVIQPKDTTLSLIKPKPIYRIPTQIDGGCWSLKGQIITTDPTSKFVVLERMSNNSVQLIVLRKRFLGFLWWQNKKQEFKAFSDCGEIEFTKIEFKK